MASSNNSTLLTNLNTQQNSTLLTNQSSQSFQTTESQRYFPTVSIPPPTIMIPPLPPFTEIDRLYSENQQLASQITDMKKQLIHKKMHLFIDQLKQFPALFKHLQNNPHVLAKLLQQFKQKQQKPLTPPPNHATYSCCHTNNYIPPIYQPYDPYYYMRPYKPYNNNSHSTVLDATCMITTIDTLPPPPISTVDIEPYIDLTDNNDDVIEITEQKIERVNVKEEYNKAMKNNKSIRCRLIRRRQFVENDLGDNIFRQCESQFMRSCQRNYNFINGMNSTIKQVEYIINPKLIQKFECKKKELMIKYGYKTENELNVILGWHGTYSVNMNNIVENNFNLSYLGKNCNNDGYFGKGIYFSEFARISEGYGDGLLLCKVILGKCYKMNTSQIQMGRGLEKGYDSHVVIGHNDNKYGEEIVIFDVDQILPCYIVKY